MSRATFFLRECPTCGRRLQIRVEYLGREVRCQHCAARFLADDPTHPRAERFQHSTLLDRANELLESYDALRNRPPR